MATKGQYLSTRVDVKVKREVKELANREQRTLSQTIALLIIEALGAREPKQQVSLEQSRQQVPLHPSLHNQRPARQSKEQTA